MTLFGVTCLIPMVVAATVVWLRASTVAVAVMIVTATRATVVFVVAIRGAMLPGPPTVIATG